MEASLTRFLNQNFQDTSYLSQGYDTTTSNLLQSQALFTNYKQAVEFEYNVQKWLGSMGSLGVSSSTLSSIAQGINYLGTGNISALSSNQGLLNLMAIAAQRAGLDIGSMLNVGITATQTNKLLKAIAQFGQEIGSSGSRVVMQQYANLFGLDIADLSALQNLTASDISNIFSSSLSYEGAKSELNYQFSQVGSRQHISQKIENILNNLVFTTAGGIADNAVMYSTWRVASLLGDVLGDAFSVPVPMIGKISIADTIKAGLAGGSLGMGLIGSIGSGLAGAGLDFSKWGGAESLSRGQGKTFVYGGVSTGVSSSGFVGNQDSAGVQNALEEQASAEAKTKAGTSESIQIEEQDRNYWKNSSTELEKIRMLLESGRLNVVVSNIGAIAQFGM